MSQEDAPQEGQEPTPAPAEPKEGQEPKGESKPETFSREYVEQLRSEAASRRKAEQELREKLEEFEERDKSELEKATGKVTKAEERASRAEAKLLRYEVAQAKDVPAKLVPLLTASTQEELEAQADLILENAKPATPEFDGGAREPAPDPKSPEEAHNDFLVGLFKGQQPN